MEHGSRHGWYDEVQKSLQANVGSLQRISKSHQTRLSQLNRCRNGERRAKLPLSPLSCSKKCPKRANQWGNNKVVAYPPAIVASTCD
ncbi:hypothetical protein H6P81_006570 [Aristolochia fimbriata]|uniref:Uncharacterized protein n=1 Tax=Aristolochia fimbriata TaxID=158543 RepID=A0AAV7EYW4_ARIFI|nr:hypothetical protein H6P81_006570 [Aristolochia fimbriata]